MSNVRPTGSVITDVVFGALPRIGTATSKLDDFVADNHVVGDVVPRWTDLVAERHQVDRVIRDAEQMFERTATRKLAPGEVGLSAAALDAGRAAVNHLRLARTSLANSLRPEVTRFGGQHGRLEYPPLNETRRQLLAAAAQGQRMLDLHAGTRRGPAAPAPAPTAAPASAPRRPQIEPATMPLSVVVSPVPVPVLEEVPTGRHALRPVTNPTQPIPRSAVVEAPPVQPDTPPPSVQPDVVVHEPVPDPVPSAAPAPAAAHAPAPELVSRDLVKAGYLETSRGLQGTLQRLTTFFVAHPLASLQPAVSGDLVHDIEEARRSLTNLQEAYKGFQAMATRRDMNGGEIVLTNRAAREVQDLIVSTRVLGDRIRTTMDGVEAAAQPQRGVARRF